MTKIATEMSILTDFIQQFIYNTRHLKYRSCYDAYAYRYCKVELITKKKNYVCKEEYAGHSNSNLSKNPFLRFRQSSFF